MRAKPYTRKKLIFDVIMLLITSFGWLVVLIPWELYRHFGPRKN